MLANGDQKKLRSYLLAVEDTEFLLRDEMRSLRFAMEYGKPELLLRDWGVRSTVVYSAALEFRLQKKLSASQKARRARMRSPVRESGRG